jgi:two-component system, LytTR family, response regulator
MISCIIVDDLKDMVDLLSSHVNAKPELKLEGTFVKPLEALEFLKTNNIDIVFLDIEMPLINGFDFIERLRNNKLKKLPSFILTTGYSQYAAESYEYEIVDYIIKPITYKRFNIAFEKYLRLKSLINNDKEYEPSEFLFVESKEKTKKLKVMFDEIIYIENVGNYISIHTYDQRFLVYKSLNSIQEVLDPNLFIRVFRSFIVSISKIESIEHGELVMKSNPVIRIPIGDLYKSRVMKRLNIL